MTPHEPLLVIGSAPGHVHETCLGCYLADGDDADPGPCTQTPTNATHLTPGALVQALPIPRWKRLPARTAIVIGSISRPFGPVALVWFWALGQPEFQRSVYAVATDEVTPMHTTLATLPRATYRVLAAQHAACRGAAARLLAPLTEPLKAASH